MKEKKEKKKKPNKRLAKAMEAYFDVSHRIGITDDMEDRQKISLLLKEGMITLLFKLVAHATNYIISHRPALSIEFNKKHR